MPRPPKEPTLADFGFSAEWIDEIESLREGFIGAPAHRVLEHALKFYLANGLKDEPAVKQRYDEERERRRVARKGRQ
jgi:hypothetical protein